MEPEPFSEFRHTAVHELMRLNELCEKEFRISEWPHWDYDLENGTLTFSENGVPKVLASIQVVGTTSTSNGTWMWSWANKHLPSTVTNDLTKLLEHGNALNIPQLTSAQLPDDEYLGWEMTAIAAALLHSKGGYRCPVENGFAYLVYTSIKFAPTGAGTATE